MARDRNARQRVWLFDLDDTLHDAGHAAFGPISEAMTAYMVAHLALPHEEAAALRQHYWRRYGATLLGLVRHHGVKPAHFLEETHRLPGLEARLRGSRHDRLALQALPGRKVLLTNAPRAYALRVLAALRLEGCFDALVCIEDMAMFGHPRPKPDRRMFRHIVAQLKVPTSRCVLVEDTLVHQRAARGLGMQTVWMQRYLNRPLDAAKNGPSLSVRRCRKPGYVCARIKRIQTLRAWCRLPHDPCA